MVALPFCHVEFNAKKPLPKSYPKALLTLGDHIRRKRLDLNLLQTDAANMVNVDEMTIVGWELNHSRPLATHIPKIIEFLDYVPEDLFPTDTSGQKIKRYRLLHGMTRMQLAIEFHIDEATVRRLETDKGKHFPQTLAKIVGILKALG